VYRAGSSCYVVPAETVFDRRESADWPSARESGECSPRAWPSEGGDESGLLVASWILLIATSIHERSLSIPTNFCPPQRTCQSGGAGAEERVEDEVALGRGGEEDALDESERLLRGMLAEFLLPRLGRRNGPDGFHLFAAGDFAHELVIEFVAGLFVARGPDDGFGGVSEVTAGEIGGRIGLDPGNVVEEFEAELLHGEADGMNDVGGATDPEGAVGFEDTLAGGEPGGVELMNFVKSDPYRVRVGAGEPVPVAFVNADHASGVAGDAAVGEEVGRVGEDEVDGGGGDGGEDLEAVAVEDFDVMARVVEGGFGELRRRPTLRRGALRRKSRSELRMGHPRFREMGRGVSKRIGSLIKME
jgi:hypothetical protein